MLIQRIMHRRNRIPTIGVNGVHEGVDHDEPITAPQVCEIVTSSSEDVMPIQKPILEQQTDVEFGLFNPNSASYAGELSRPHS